MSYKLILDPDYVSLNGGEIVDSFLISSNGWISEYARIKHEQSDYISTTYADSLPLSSNLDIVRDFIVTPDGELHTYGGSSEAVLNGYNWKSQYSNYTKTYPNWSTADNSFSGGIDYYQDYIFVTDMKTSKTDEQGIIRFSQADKPAVRFAERGNFIDLTVGLDNLIYGLEVDGKISVYDPDTLAFVRSLTLENSSNDYRGIAVNQQGEVFSAAWNGNIYYFSPQGNIVDVNEADDYYFKSNNFNDINISPDGKELIAGDKQGLIALLYIKPGRLELTELFPTGGDSAFVSFGNKNPITEQNYQIEVSISDAEVLEGDSGELTWMNFTVSLSDAAEEVVAVDVRSYTPWELGNFQTNYGFAHDSEFVSTTETIYFNPGEIEKTFSVTIIGDLSGTAEGDHDEQIYAEIDSVVSGDVVIGDGIGDGLIIDNEAKKPQLSISDAEAVEGAALEFTVSLDQAFNDYLTVEVFDVNYYYKTYFPDRPTPAHVTKEEDYLSNREFLTFAPGETSKTFTVDTIADSLIEGDEQLPVRIISDNSDVYLRNKIGIGIVQDNDLVIGEVGYAEDVTDNIQQIQFQNEYENPVVIVSPLTRNGGDPAIARITDIQADGFSVFVQEPTLLKKKNHSGAHTREDFSYMVVEAGTWTMADGSVIEAGLTEVDTYTRTQNWDRLELEQDFNESVIISSIQTYNNEELLRLRQRNGNESGIDLALEKEEALLRTDYAGETVGYIAVESGEHNLFSEGISYAAGETGRTVNHRWQQLDQVNNHPYVFASTNSYYGGDSVGLRYQMGSIMLDEDTSRDYEIAHTKEDVAFLGFDNLGVITAEF